MIKLLLKDRTLMAVPAVHNRAVFARHVHTSCVNEKSRPDAIAVELGSGAVAAVSTWFKELGMGLGTNKMPFMLGVTCHNKRIHPKHRDKTIFLQKKYGAPLHKIPQSVLWEELGYAAVSFLCLSPTDSIIEAIRCGVEFGIPVYGIDLEETAPLEKKSFVIEDPLAAQDDLE